MPYPWAPLGDHILGNSLTPGPPQWATNSQGTPYPWTPLDDQIPGNSLALGYLWATSC